MNKKIMPKLSIGDLKIKLPIVQGGMGIGVSLSGLAAAVANAGGIGVISSVGIGLFEHDFEKNSKEANLRALRSEIRKARKSTDGVIGINVMMALSDYEDIIKVAIEEAIDVVFVGAGMILKKPRDFSIEYIQKMRTKIVPIVSSARAAKIIFNSWAKKYNHVPDAVVVEGPLAGGHLGFKNEQIDDPKFALDKIVPQVVEAISSFKEKFSKNIPIIAGGGIFTGKDIADALDNGADAVQMGTRFVATEECDASEDFKQQYVNSKPEDIVIIKSPVGLPGRAINGTFLEEVVQGIRKPFTCPWKCLKTCNMLKAPYCIAKALLNAQQGHFENGFAFAGANVHRINKIVSVKELINSLIEEYENS